MIPLEARVALKKLEERFSEKIEQERKALEQSLSDELVNELHSIAYKYKINFCRSTDVYDHLFHRGEYYARNLSTEEISYLSRLFVNNTLISSARYANPAKYGSVDNHAQDLHKRCYNVSDLDQIDWHDDGDDGE